MKVAIIGAGITGLSTAYYLKKHISCEIDIYEKDGIVGGLAATTFIQNFWIEKYYHHIFTHDKYFLDLAKELGIYSLIEWQKSRVGFYSENKIYPFTTPFDLINFKPINVFNRIRFGTSSILISKYKNYNNLENLNTEEFLIKFVGKQAFQKVWKPMLKIKFGENYNKIPAVWIWNRIVQRFKSRSKSTQNEILGYMKGSFHVFIKKLYDYLINTNVSIFLNSNVNEISIDKDNCTGIFVNNIYAEYDHVICTTSLPVFVELCKNAPPSYINPLKRVKYDASLVMLMVLDEKLSDIYWLNISDNDIPFGGLIEHTNLVSSTDFSGKTILYFSKYLNPNDKLMSMKDTDILKLYVDNLKKIYPTFNENIINEYYIFKDKYAQPIWPMNYSKFKPKYNTPIKGLFMANTAQAYPNDRGMNFSIKLGKEVSSCIVAPN